MSPKIIPCQRFLFDIPEEVAFLNCANLAPSLKSVRAAGEMGVARKSTPWMITSDNFFDESEILRNLVATLIGTSSQNIAIIPSVSYGIATAAANLHLDQGKHCLILGEQFPSNAYAWLEKDTQNPSSVRTINRPEQGSWTDAVLAGMDDQTGLVALPHCHWTDGSLLDLEAIGEQCQNLSIPLVLDVTQSLGALPLNLDKVKPAFMIAAAYKWLLGPYSMAFMYVDPAYHGGIPLEKNWITRQGSRNFAGLVNYTTELVEGAVRYDMGQRSNFALQPMAIAALEQILAWEIPAIQASLRALTDLMVDHAKTLGFQPGTETRAGHLLGIRREEPLPQDLISKLAEQNIFVGARGNALRLSPHLYNHEGDVHRFFNVLEWQLKQG